MEVVVDEAEVSFRPRIKINEQPAAAMARRMKYLVPVTMVEV